MSVVLDLNDWKDYLTGLALHNVFILLHKHCALQLVLAFTVTAFFANAFAEVFLHIVYLFPWNMTVFAVNTHLFEEIANHSFPGMSVMTASTSATLLLFVSFVMSTVFLSSGLFRKNSNHHRRCTTGISDLEEWVIVA